MSDNTFDAAKNYKKICYRADRDLLNTELNEAQDIETRERRLLLDKILAQGTIILGLAGTVNSDQVSIDDGVVYLDGCAVNVPGCSLNFSSAGEHLIYLDVFRREVTASDDPSLVNPLTGEPTAEREKWIATLQTRDTANDPLPDSAISRTVTPVYIFNGDTEELRPYVGSSLSGEDVFSALANHAGHGGIDRHPAVTLEIAGFMTPEQAVSLSSVEAALPNKADVSLLSVHKASGDHDSRYYTESETDTRFAPIGHVGTGGNAHASATATTSGFMGAADKAQLGEHESRLDNMETALPGKADDADVSLVSDALATHRSSADHDSRYYTEAESDGRFAQKSHIGTGGSAHSVATTAQAGFMNASDKSQLASHETRISSVEAALPGKADDSEITAVQDTLNAHKTSGDHDSRYFTEGESNARFAPIAHVGSGGGVHASATTSAAGFMSPSDKAKLDSLERDCLPGYLVSLLHGTNLDYSSASGWPADWDASTNEKADIGRIYSPRGGFFYGSGYSSPITFRFRQKFRLAATESLTFRMMARDDSMRIYLEKISDNSIISVGGFSGDSETPGSVTVANVAVGDYWLYVYLNNSGGDEVNIILRDWHTPNVACLLDT